MDNELKIEYGDGVMYGGDPDKIDFGGLVPNNNPLSMESASQSVGVGPMDPTRSWNDSGRVYGADYTDGVSDMSSVPMQQLEGNPRHVGNKTRAYGIARTPGSGLGMGGALGGGEEYQTGDRYDMTITEIGREPGKGKVATKARFATDLDRSSAIGHGFKEEGLPTYDRVVSQDKLALGKLNK